MAGLLWLLGASLMFSGGLVFWNRIRGRATTKEALPLGAGLLGVGLLLIVLTYQLVDADPTPTARPPTLPNPAGESAPSPPPAASPTSSPGPEATQEEIREAYLRFEKVYADAFLHQDPSVLEEVAASSALETIRGLVEESRAKNEVWSIRVENAVTRIVFGDGIGGPGLGGLVHVKSVDHSVRLDAETRTAIDPDQNLQLDKSYTMKPIGGTWKVVHITQYDEP